MEVNGFERAKGAAGFFSTTGGGGGTKCPGGVEGVKKTHPKTGVFFLGSNRDFPKKCLEFRFFFGNEFANLKALTSYAQLDALFGTCFIQNSQRFQTPVEQKNANHDGREIKKKNLDNKNDT